MTGFDELTEGYKQDAIRALVGADGTAEVHSTEYFNHTFAPDLVLRWGKKKERYVYLRTTTNPAYLIEDASRVDAASSIVMPLAEVSGKAYDGYEDKRTLISGLPSFRFLAEAGAQRPVVGLASRLLLQGGHGLLSTDTTASFGRSVDDGFEAAQQGASDATSRALHEARDLLDQSGIEQVSDFLEAVWVGSGAPRSDFPGASTASPVMSDDALAVLLDSVEIHDYSFWRRVGSRLTLDQLVTRRWDASNVNFQRLINANLDRLRARRARVTAADSAPVETLRWFARDGFLGVRMEGAEILFSDMAFDAFPDGRDSTMTLNALRLRASRFDFGASTIATRADNRRIDFSATDDSSVLDEGDRLIDGAVDVLSATLRTNPEMIVNLQSSSLRGNTGAKFEVRYLVENAAAMLFASNESDQDRLLELSRYIGQLAANTAEQ